jgi:membrane protease subunit (stomatin/prohibitin family)
MAIVDIVRWDARSDQLAWKYPSTELGSWTQLIVSESQEAWLLFEGRPIGPYAAGRHVLDLPNYPGMTGLIKTVTGGKTPFTAEVWFLNKAINLSVKWGTSTPIQLQDPRFKIMLPVRAHGQLGLQITNTSKFLLKLVGTQQSFDVPQFTNYFRGVILTKTKDTVATLLTEKKLSILDVAAHLNEISDELKNALNNDFEEFGLSLVTFYVNSIDTPDDDPAVSRLKEALAKKAEMDILGYNYQQERSFDALEAAAGNTGNAGGVMGAGMGLGMGVGIGQGMGAGMGQAAQQINFGSLIPCPSCRIQNSNDAAYCKSCGNSLRPAAMQLVVCQKCGKSTPPGAFCSHCAAPQDSKCTSCNTPIIAGARFCPGCGKPVK